MLTLIATRLCLLTVLLGASAVLAADPAAPRVVAMRVPNNGIQPQAAVDDKNVVHLLYFKGDERHGDLFYTRSADAGDTWTNAIRVNSQPNSAIAIGTMRHAHMALGKNGRVHVSWMGSDQAQPRAPRNAAPMLYARLNDAADAFENQRNLIQHRPGLDGGGSVAADSSGNVFVAWHAPQSPDGNEQDRRVWLARSTDDGKSFAPESAISPPGTGSCGCCGMRITASPAGLLHVLFRGAADPTHRDIYLLISNDRGANFTSTRVADWEIAKCPASTAAFAHSKSATFGAWESHDGVHFGRIDPTGRIASPLTLLTPRARRHPALATNDNDLVLLTWSEATAWGKGGPVAWQIFNKHGEPLKDTTGRRDDLPPWSLPAAFPRPDGTFDVLY